MRVRFHHPLVVEYRAGRGDRDRLGGARDVGHQAGHDRSRSEAGAVLVAGAHDDRAPPVEPERVRGLAGQRPGDLAGRA